MKRWLLERRLRRELKAAAKPDFQALADRAGLRRQKKLPLCRRPAFRTAVAAFCLLAVCLTVALPLLLPGDGGVPTGTPSAGYLLFDINPSCSIAYDENGRVTSALGLNRDGEILLSGADLIGKTYEEASEFLFARCLDLGYFSPARQDNAVLLSATTDDGSADLTVRNDVEQTLYQQFSNSHMFGVVITSVDDPALSQAAEAYGISVQKYMLIQQYLQLGGSLDTSRYASIPIRDLYTGISTLEEQSRKQLATQLEYQTKQLFERIAEDVEDIIEGIDDHLEELEEALGLEDRWETVEDLLDELEDIAERIEDANTASECEQILSLVRDGLAGLRPILPSALKASLSEALTALDDSALLLRDYDTTTETVEEAYQKRAQSNWDMTPVEGEMSEEWRDSQILHFSQAWYQLKSDWDDDRDDDFDDWFDDMLEDLFDE